MQAGNSGETPRRTPSGERVRSFLVVAALLVSHYTLALAGVWHKSVTFDEIAHITSGYAIWRYDDYRLFPENGNLPQRWSALPLVLFGSDRFPDRGQQAWRASNVWVIGDQFFHESGNDAESLLRRSRAAMALLSAALCLVVFLWARRLYGATGGFVALTLCAFSPLVLAHGSLATSDLCAALFLLLGTWSFWECLHRATPLRLIGCAASLAGLALSKTSALLFVPTAVLMMAASLFNRSEPSLSLGGSRSRSIRTVWGRLLVMLGVAFLCGLVVWGAIWLGYGCRYEPVPPGEQRGFAGYLGPGTPIPTLARLAELTGTPGRVLLSIGERGLLPDAFLYGTGRVLATMNRPAFFNGQYSSEGWRSFFPYCFLVKSTLPMLLLCLLAAVAALGAPLHKDVALRGGVSASAPVWILLLVTWTVLIFSAMNIGARHMLPVYPATCILIGALARHRKTRWLRWLAAMLLIWHLGEGLRAFPDYLASFNQITGRKHAYRHLVESSLDWGQDLPGLKVWLDHRLSAGAPTPVYLSYFGTGSPGYYGIPAQPLELEARAAAGLPPLAGAGIYCVSATNLQGVYAPVRGAWDREREAAYQAAANEMVQLLVPGERRPRDGGAQQELDAAAIKQRYYDLGTARLMAFLREREPDHQIGYSILVFELSETQIRSAFDGPPPYPAASGSSRNWL